MTAETSGGKACDRVENGQSSQVTKRELREKYPDFIDNCRGAHWERESCKATSTWVAVSVKPCKTEMTSVTGTEIPMWGTDSAVSLAGFCR